MEIYGGTADGVATIHVMRFDSGGCRDWSWAALLNSKVILATDSAKRATLLRSRSACPLYGTLRHGLLIARNLRAALASVLALSLDEC